jgi:hypothetical protein
VNKLLTVPAALVASMLMVTGCAGETVAPEPSSAPSFSADPAASAEENFVNILAGQGLTMDRFAQVDFTEPSVVSLGEGLCVPLAAGDDTVSSSAARAVPPLAEGLLLTESEATVFYYAAITSFCPEFLDS